jgi:hypothetical protein
MSFGEHDRSLHLPKIEQLIYSAGQLLCLPKYLTQAYDKRLIPTCLDGIVDSSIPSTAEDDFDIHCLLYRSGLCIWSISVVRSGLQAKELSTRPSNSTNSW